MAGLGDLPDTLMSRSVVVRMRRRAPGEVVEPFRYRAAAPEGHAIRDRVARWVADVVDDLGGWPVMPPGITDRPADVWEPLLAVADAAGGHWPGTARAACVELCKVVADRDVSLGIRLLADLQVIFGDEDRLGTETILERLHRVDEGPWADLRGRPLDSRGLARRLNGYGIASTKIKVGTASLRGYRREDLFDAWQRYLSPVPQEAEPPEPAEPGERNPSEEAADAAVALVLATWPGAELVSADLVDLPLGEVGTCRHCRSSTVVEDDRGPVCRTCRGAA